MVAGFVWVVPATVTAEIDGDSMWLNLDLGWRISLLADCRLGHINALEHGTPAGDAATAYVTALLPVGSRVTFASHKRDKWGRPLGDITLADGRDLGKLLVESGHAVPYEGGAR